MRPTNLTQAIQLAAAKTYTAMSPMDVLIGKVVSIEPLKIHVGTVNAELTKDHLILTNAVTDHFVDIHVNHLTDTISGIRLTDTLTLELVQFQQTIFTLTAVERK